MIRLAEILTAAGYTVRKDHSDMAPFQLKIIELAPGPSWRDWLEAERDRTHEIMKETHHG
ncbi:hypothetical protein [Amycolatopsis magusensis]|uniref:hypothetical protein n=1 Tax=Amycolatopsis magusensis TaxID=882444 RepID=UPI003C2B54C8